MLLSKYGAKNPELFGSTARGIAVVPGPPLQRRRRQPRSFGRFHRGGGQRYLRYAEGESIRQWWPGSPETLARLLAETTLAWDHQPHRAHRNRGVAMLVWDRTELMLDVGQIRDRQVPGPDAVAHGA